MKTESVIAALAAIIATAAFADRTVTEKSPDGVNTITKTVNDAGYVTGEAMTLVHVPQKYVPPTDAENADAKQAMIEIIEAAKRQADEEMENAVIAEHVYGENPTNSSFIVRRELTATQKRFLALGRRYTELAIGYMKLEARILELEAEAANRNRVKILEVK